jgi:hypothetical protein
MKRDNPKAKGWIVEGNGVPLGLCKPAKGYVMPQGVDKVFFISSRPTVFSDRTSAQCAIDNRKEFDKLNKFNPHTFPDMRIVTLYEQK